MPWRTAAGVLGMERTTLAVAPRWLAKYFSVLPAAIDRNTAPAIGEAAQVRQHGIHGLRLDREDDDLRRLADLAAGRDAAQPVLARPQRLDRLGDDRIGRRQPARQPAFQHGAAHLAAADQQQLAPLSTAIVSGP